MSTGTGMHGCHQDRKVRFITFEGPEGSGKSTQAKRLVEHLKAAGCPTILVREPGGTQTGEAIRGILQHMRIEEPMFPETEVLLFAASRSQLVRSIILPSLDQNKWVVCDRYADSTTAYQGYGRGLPIDKLQAVNEFAMKDVVPDLTILLDLDVDVGFQRIQKRVKETNGELDRLERESREFHQRIRRGYLELARKHTDRFRVFDAARPEDVVESDVWTLVHGLVVSAGSARP